MTDKRFTYLLNRWVEKTISQEELEDLKQYEDFSLYERILEESTGFIVPKIDDTESFKNFMNKASQIRRIKKTPPKIKSTNYITIVSGIAASIVLIIAVYQFYFSKQNYTTDFKEQLSLTLPDNSEVILNSKSSLSYSKRNWEKNRLVQLKGEALFNIHKGHKFRVVTPEGEIYILGTTFNAKANKGLFEVQCFEGEVIVQRNNQSDTLIKGEAIRYLDQEDAEKWTFQNDTTSWVNKEVSLRNIPIKFVLLELERCYGITVKSENIDLTKRFTGSFPSNDLQLALEMISESLAINYKTSNNLNTITFFK